MKVPYVKAINDALKEEMRRDGKIVVYGEDVAEFGGIFGETRGLLEEFGQIGRASCRERVSFAV